MESTSDQELRHKALIAKACVGFFDRFAAQNIQFGKHNENETSFLPVYVDIEAELAEYLEVDEVTMKDAMAELGRDGKEGICRILTAMNV